MDKNQQKFPRVELEFRPEPVVTLRNYTGVSMAQLDRAFYAIMRAVAQERARALHEARVDEMDNQTSENKDVA